MSWIILEGLDRTGKSTVAELYKRQGYEAVHFSAPNKKYTQPGYTGPSYMDEVLEIYMNYMNKDVVFDRSLYGEFVWPFVYGRNAQLNDEDVEVLQELESANNVERYLLYDPNVEAHWKRCVDNKEPLNRPQFNQANLFFDKMARKYDFKKKTLEDFSALQKSLTVDLTPPKQETVTTHPGGGSPGASSGLVTASVVEAPTAKTVVSSISKLEKANAINDILAKRIIKQKGEAYDALETEVRDFLSKKLSTIFGEEHNSNFSPEEVLILKMYVKQLKQKLETKR